MGILDELLLELSEETLDTQVYEICNNIQEEEGQPDEKYAPKGPNIFLCLEYQNEINDRTIKFLTLERDMPGRYFIGYWYTNRVDGDVRPSLKISKSIDIKENKAKEIITTFAKTYKFEKGIELNG